MFCFSKTGLLYLKHRAMQGCNPKGKEGGLITCPIFNSLTPLTVIHDNEQNKIRYAITGVVATGFLFLGLYFIAPGWIAYRSEQDSFFAYFFTPQPNWDIVKGAFFIALGLGLAIGNVPK
jgi:hypothetical protein